MTDSSERFGGIARLLGGAALEALRNAHVCVVGMGGVGSWTVEALARSGIGRFTLVDLDDVCVTNINRQVHALETTVGQLKVEVMAARIRQINPAAEVEAVARFFNAETATQILAAPYACVVDAIDNSANKSRLIAGCRAARLAIVTSGGVGGRRDPTRVRVDDLANTSHDRLLAQVRAILRQECGFPPAGTPFGVPCVYSNEPPVFPKPDGTPGSQGERDPTVPGPGLSCDAGLGTASFVSGTFGFFLANLAVEQVLAAHDRSSEPSGRARLAERAADTEPSALGMRRPRRTRPTNG